MAANAAIETIASLVISSIMDYFYSSVWEHHTGEPVTKDVTFLAK